MYGKWPYDHLYVVLIGRGLRGNLSARYPRSQKRTSKGISYDDRAIVLKHRDSLSSYALTYVALKEGISVVLSTLMLCVVALGRNASVRPISLLRLSLLRLLDSNFQGNSLWAWEFHPVNFRF